MKELFIAEDLAVFVNHEEKKYRVFEEGLVQVFYLNKADIVFDEMKEYMISTYVNTLQLNNYERV